MGNLLIALETMTVRLDMGMHVGTIISQVVPVRHHRGDEEMAVTGN
jgi:hypothetical protein